MSNIQVFITTFNCGKKTPINSEFTNELSKKLPNDISNLYVFGFQEIASILDSTDFNLINKKLIWISNNLISCLNLKFNIETIELISINHFGSIGLIILSPFKSKINQIIKSVGYPVGHFYTNLKGGIGIRIKYDLTEYTFVCMHLNAGEKIENLLRRNNDIYNILSKLKFDDDWCVLKPNSHVFIFGDLNYRTTSAFGLSSIDNNNNNNNNSLDLDELLILMKSGLLLEKFKEANISFKPTYKYIVGTNNYNKKRMPSFCDRILYLDYLSYSKLSKYEIIKYDSIDNCLLSDHKPVYLIVNTSNEPPESSINELGYLIDRSTELIEYSKNYRRNKFGFFILQLSYCTTFLMGLGLYLVITNKGRIIILSIIGLILLLFKWNWI